MQGSRGARILIVDDNVGTVAATVKFLELSGFDARGAESACAALELAVDFEPDVAILDLGLPDLDGFELLARLREQAHPRDVRAIALSGRTDDETIESARAHGFSDYLIKPARLDAIKSAVERVAST